MVDINKNIKNVNAERPRADIVSCFIFDNNALIFMSIRAKHLNDDNSSEFKFRRRGALFLSTPRVTISLKYYLACA